ncbi:MAG: glutamine cyclotransferase [Bacteroidetes bacterium]|nr:MAG: glutamine cyclotransferase [Bacteroidota bacterium]
MKRHLLFILIIISIIGCHEDKKTSKTTSKKTKSSSTITQKPVKVPEFNGQSAYDFVKKQVDFGPRVVNSKAHKKCGTYLVQTLSQYADTVFEQNAKVRAYNQSILNIKNIIASFNPEKEKRVLLASHWDSRPFADYDKDKKNHWTPIDGANDGASGVGVLLEVARLLKQHPINIGIDIILFDAEDYGAPQFVQTTQQDDWALGSQYWSKNPHTYGYQANYGILLDMVGASNARFPKEAFSLYYAPNVVNKVWRMAKQLNYGEYFIEEEGTTIMDDHYYVNQLTNIPMIDIIHLDNTTDNNTFFEHWHTTKDNIDIIDKETLRIVGDVLLHVIYQE